MSFQTSTNAMRQSMTCARKKARCATTRQAPTSVCPSRRERWASPALRDSRETFRTKSVMVRHICFLLIFVKDPIYREVKHSDHVVHVIAPRSSIGMSMYVNTIFFQILTSASYLVLLVQSIFARTPLEVLSVVENRENRLKRLSQELQRHHHRQTSQPRQRTTSALQGLELDLMMSVWVSNSNLRKA